MKLRFAVTCLLLLSLTLNLRGQVQDQDVVRITTNLVQVDVVVTKDGKHITDLKPEDFEILEDGRRQQITSFAYVTTNTPPSETAAPKNTEAPAVIPKPPLPKEIKRTVAIVVDDLGMSFQSMANLRTYLSKFVSENLRPNDLVAIIRTGGEVGALQQFTADPRVLANAIADLKWNPCSRLGASVLSPERDASLNKSTRLPKVTTRTLVFRDAVKIYSSDSADVNTEGQPDLQRISAGARLRLGPALTPGEYVVQIVVEDQLSKRTVTKLTQFEVR